MVHLSRANVVSGIVRPFTHGIRTAGNPGRSEAQSGRLCADPLSAFGDLKRGWVVFVPPQGRREMA
jgi:hypothetical protein